MEDRFISTTSNNNAPGFSSLPGFRDINCNEAPSPCFLSIRLNPGLQNVDARSLDFHYHSSEEEEEGEREWDWPKERWSPLGAAGNSRPSTPTPASAVGGVEPSVQNVDEQLKQLEEEQSQLNSSLLALTSHFAQVQFRLKQIVNAEPSQRECLLKELEEFAFKGIPDVRGCKAQDAQLLEEMSTREHEQRLTAQRRKQRELITQLKSQLEDLETYAYESGHADHPPTSQVLEKQKVVLEEIRRKLHLNLHNFDTLSTEELKEIVDNAIASIVNPVKVKEKLIDQLKTQVVDLERFIQYLQGETDNPGPYGETKCACPVHSKVSNYSEESGTPDKGKGDKSENSAKGSEATAMELMKKALTILQIYVFSQLGCAGQDMQQNILRKTAPKNNNDWGELKERLEAAVSCTVDLALQQHQRDQQWQKDCCSTASTTVEEICDRETEELEFMSSPAVTLCVRKELALALRDLMQHGLVEMSSYSGLVRFGCFSSRSAPDVRSKMHAWDLLTRFYEMKHGREYKESPTRMLSQSFHLDMVGGRPLTAKQTLLGAIDTVLNANQYHHHHHHHHHHHSATHHHRYLHYGKDAYFKAFVCLALNERKLVTWLRLLFRTQTLIDKHYLDWSCVARTGFEDTLQCLEKLLVVNFRLPVDLSVRSFSNSNDAF